MFKAWDWLRKKAFTVYDVLFDNGDCHFLVYDDCWLYRDSDCFVEYTGQDVYPFEGERKDND